MSRRLSFAAWLSPLFLVVSTSFAAPQKSEQPDLAEYRTVDTALSTRISKASATAAGVPGYLGVHVTPAVNGKLQVAHVETDSPAWRAGFKNGDELLKFGDTAVPTPELLRELLQAKSPGDLVQFTVARGKETMQLSATLTATSKALKLGSQRAVMGVFVGDVKDGGLPVNTVTTGGSADKAGLKKGDLLLKIDSETLSDGRPLTDVLAIRNPGDVVMVTYRREDKEDTVKVVLGGEEVGGGGKGGGGKDSWDTRNLNIWRKPGYRLAIIGIEYTDVQHNAKVAAKDWEQAMFSTGVYHTKSVTGQPVYGSLADYYWEQSFKKLKVEGKMFDWVKVSKKRLEYNQGAGGGAGQKTALLTEAIDVLLARDGKDALKDFDGVFFLYAGDRVQTNRGSLYWPHRATVKHQAKSWPYFIVQEGGSKMNDISVFCHEFGHMLGLPDLYAQPERPGMEGVGVWCAMANQKGGGRPQHFCAWSKDQLGWVTPCVIDPTTKQKLILSPVEDSPKEVFKVLVKTDGSEYFLLENRKKKGFDSSLPAEGLLIWRVIGNRPVLEESHGVEGPQGPNVFLGSVPFPSPSNNAFTPFTTPSSRSLLGGGLPVHITNIRRLPDGRITFHIGYEYL